MLMGRKRSGIVIRIGNLSLKQGDCFVLFYHAEISQTIALHVVLLVLKALADLKLFGPTMWKLLTIEPFSQ
jgi:hypothetical protein